MRYFILQVTRTTLKSNRLFAIHYSSDLHGSRSISLNKHLNKFKFTIEINVKLLIYVEDGIRSKIKVTEAKVSV